jgi:O-antigen/teichoic acid export membrane protein
MVVKKIFGNFFKIGLSNYIARSISAIIAVLLARWLGPTDFGMFSLGFYSLTIFGMGFVGFDKTYVNFAIKKTAQERAIFYNYSTLKLIVSFSIVLLFLLIMVVFNLLNIFKNPNWYIIFFGLLSGIGMQIFQIILSHFQARKQFTSYSKVNILYYVILIFLVLGGIQFNIENIHYYLLIYLFSGAILMVFYRKVRFSFSYLNKEILVNIFWNFGKWLIVYELLKYLNARLDFFFVSRYFSGDSLGLYSVALKLVNIFNVLIGSLAILLLPKASSISNINDLKKYWEESFKLILVLLISWITIFFLTPLIIKCLFGQQYLGSVSIMRLLLFTVLPFTFVLPYVYLFIFAKKLHQLFLITLMQSFILFIIIPALVNKFGIYGVGFGRLISYFVLLLIFAITYINIKKDILKELVGEK